MTGAPQMDLRTSRPRQHWMTPSLLLLLPPRMPRDGSAVAGRGRRRRNPGRRKPADERTGEENPLKAAARPRMMTRRSVRATATVAAGGVGGAEATASAAGSEAGAVGGEAAPAVTGSGGVVGVAARNAVGARKRAAGDDRETGVGAAVGTEMGDHPQLHPGVPLTPLEEAGRTPETLQNDPSISPPSSSSSDRDWKPAIPLLDYAEKEEKNSGFNRTGQLFILNFNLTESNTTESI